MTQQENKIVMPGLVGRRCVVTGAASGIGDAVARLLTDSGASVTSLDVREPSAPLAAHIACDLSDPAAVRAAAEQAAGCDVLCNVAGIPATHSAARVMAVNFLGARLLSESILPTMGAGSAIVNVASTAGFRWQERIELLLELVATESFEDGAAWYADCRPDETAGPEIGPYEISKEALTVYTMAASRRAWERGVRVNAVSPGPVETPILGDFEDTMGKELLDWVKHQVGRHATPADVAPLVAFYASPVSGWVNGFNTIADGGMLGAMTTGAIALPTA